jgi:hypothetical protein
MPSLIFPKHGVVGALSRLLALKFVSERRQAGMILSVGLSSVRSRSFGRPRPRRSAPVQEPSIIVTACPISSPTTLATPGRSATRCSSRSSSRVVSQGLKCPIPQPTCCEHHRVPAVISAPVRDRQFGPANVARRRHRLVGSAVAGSPGLLDRRESRSAAPAGTAAPAPHR